MFNRNRLGLMLISVMLTACFSLTHAQWSPDTIISLSTADALTSFNNARCVAANGNQVYAVWFDSRHGLPNREIYMRRSLDGGVTWEGEQRLTNNDAWSGYPSIALDGQNVHVVWFDDRDGVDDNNIYYKHSTDAGVNWSADMPLTSNVLMQDFPSVAASNGYVHAVFTDEKNGNWEIYYRRSTTGGVSWEPEVRLTNDPAWSNSAGVAAQDQYVHVTWSDDRAWSGHFDNYYMRSTDYGQTWGSAVRLTNSYSGGSPTLALAGSVLDFVYMDKVDGNYEIYFMKSTNNGADWGSSSRLTNDTAISYDPAVAAWNSNVHVAWYDYRSGMLPEIYYKRTTDQGATWEPDVRLTNDPLRSFQPYIALGDSVVHVVWYDDRRGTYNIYYKRDPTGNQYGISESRQIGHPGSVSTAYTGASIFSGALLLPKGGNCRIFDYAGRMVSPAYLKPGVYFIEIDGVIIQKVVKVK